MKRNINNIFLYSSFQKENKSININHYITANKNKFFSFYKEINFLPLSKKNKNLHVFFNFSFDKSRLKNFVLWFLKTYGQKKTIELLEQLKDIGFNYATKAGISLGIDDLKIPPQKTNLLLLAQQKTNENIFKYKRGEITDVERLQKFIDTWHQTSENLKKEVVRHFESTDILNPVYMMAFSGARGNLSQVRQLVGMRGLMADPQGQIIDFPIQSNFREGLTLTEYIISTYGARKGIVDTALRTANAGYLTRRLVDVAQHVIVSEFDCATSHGIVLFEMKEGNKTIYSLENRLIGRVLAKNVFFENQKIASRNDEISIDLAKYLTKISKKIFIRSPLTCQTKKFVCQLCYGWSLSSNRFVAVGEAVGVIAAQSIGEPGTQLTMRTFHTGGVFSGGISDQIIAQHDGIVEYNVPISGLCVRTPQGEIAFLTKSSGSLTFKEKVNNFSFQNVVNKTQIFNIPPYTLLFARNGQKVFKKQIIAQLTSTATQTIQRSDDEQTIYSEYEGEIYNSSIDILKKKNEYEDISFFSWGWGYFWILAGKIYQFPIESYLFAKTGDVVDKDSILNRLSWLPPESCFFDVNTGYQWLSTALNRMDFVQMDNCIPSSTNITSNSYSPYSYLNTSEKSFLFSSFMLLHSYSQMHNKRELSLVQKHKGFRQRKSSFLFEKEERRKRIDKEKEELKKRKDKQKNGDYLQKKNCYFYGPYNFLKIKSFYFNEKKLFLNHFLKIKNQQIQSLINKEKHTSMRESYKEITNQYICNYPFHEFSSFFIIKKLNKKNQLSLSNLWLKKMKDQKKRNHLILSNNFVQNIFSKKTIQSKLSYFFLSQKRQKIQFKNLLLTDFKHIHNISIFSTIINKQKKETQLLIKPFLRFSTFYNIQTNNAFNFLFNSSNFFSKIQKNQKIKNLKISHKKKTKKYSFQNQQRTNFEQNILLKKIVFSLNIKSLIFDNFAYNFKIQPKKTNQIINKQQNKNREDQIYFFSSINNQIHNKNYKNTYQWSPQHQLFLQWLPCDFQTIHNGIFILYKPFSKKITKMSLNFDIKKRKDLSLLQKHRFLFTNSEVIQNDREKILHLRNYAIVNPLIFTDKYLSRLLNKRENSSTDFQSYQFVKERNYNGMNFPQISEKSYQKITSLSNLKLLSKISSFTYQIKNLTLKEKIKSLKNIKKFILFKKQNLNFNYQNYKIQLINYDKSFIKKFIIKSQINSQKQSFSIVTKNFISIAKLEKSSNDLSSNFLFKQNFYSKMLLFKYRVRTSKIKNSLSLIYYLKSTSFLKLFKYGILNHPSVVDFFSSSEILLSSAIGNTNFPDLFYSNRKDQNALPHAFARAKVMLSHSLSLLFEEKRGGYSQSRKRKAQVKDLFSSLMLLHKRKSSFLFDSYSQMHKKREGKIRDKDSYSQMQESIREEKRGEQEKISVNTDEIVNMNSHFHISTYPSIFSLKKEEIKHKKETRNYEYRLNNLFKKNLINLIFQKPKKIIYQKWNGYQRQFNFSFQRHPLKNKYKNIVLKKPIYQNEKIYSNFEIKKEKVFKSKYSLNFYDLFWLPQEIYFFQNKQLAKQSFYLHDNYENNKLLDKDFPHQSKSTFTNLNLLQNQQKQVQNFVCRNSILTFNNKLESNNSIFYKINRQGLKQSYNSNLNGIIKLSIKENSKPTQINFISNKKSSLNYFPYAFPHAFARAKVMLSHSLSLLFEEKRGGYSQSLKKKVQVKDISEKSFLFEKDEITKRKDEKKKREDLYEIGKFNVFKFFKRKLKSGSESHKKNVKNILKNKSLSIVYKKYSNQKSFFTHLFLKNKNKNINCLQYFDKKKNVISQFKLSTKSDQNKIQYPIQNIKNKNLNKLSKSSLIQIKQGWIYFSWSKNNFYLQKDNVFTFYPGKPIIDDVIFEKHRVLTEHIVVNQPSSLQFFTPVENKVFTIKADQFNYLGNSLNQSFKIEKILRNEKPRFWDLNIVLKLLSPNYYNSKDKHKEEIKKNIDMLNKNIKNCPLALFIQPMYHKLLPNKSFYKRKISCLKNHLTYPFFSSLKRKFFHSSLLNKQNVDKKLLSKYPGIDFKMNSNFKTINIENKKSSKNVKISGFWNMKKTKKYKSMSKIENKLKLSLKIKKRDKNLISSKYFKNFIDKKLSYVGFQQNSHTYEQLYLSYYPLNFLTFQLEVLSPLHLHYPFNKLFIQIHPNFNRFNKTIYSLLSSYAFVNTNRREKMRVFTNAEVEKNETIGLLPKYLSQPVFNVFFIQNSAYLANQKLQSNLFSERMFLTGTMPKLMSTMLNTFFCFHLGESVSSYTQIQRLKNEMRKKEEIKHQEDIRNVIINANFASKLSKNKLKLINKDRNEINLNFPTFRNQFLLNPINNLLPNSIFAFTSFLSPYIGEILQLKKHYWFEQNSNSVLILTKSDLFSLSINEISYSKTRKNKQLKKFLNHDTKASVKPNREASVKNEFHFKKFLSQLNKSFLEKEAILKKIYEFPVVESKNIFIQFQKKLYKIKGLNIGIVSPYQKLRISSFLIYGDIIYPDYGTNQAGQIIHMNCNKITLRYAQAIAASPKGLLHYYNNHFVHKNSPVVTLPFKTLKTGDIVQGIPKVEQYFEARTSKAGRLFLDSLPNLLQGLFKRYQSFLPLKKAVRQSLIKIQQIIIDGIQRVYRSQGVGIVDKHLEVIVRQMTSKVQIINSGKSGFFPGELFDIEFVEYINTFLMTEIIYEPLILGITRASLSVDSFLSAASFQHTTKILSQAAMTKKKDFLKGLKENLMTGNLIPGGTGYLIE